MFDPNENMMHKLKTGKTIQQDITDQVFASYGGLAVCEENINDQRYVFSVRDVVVSIDAYDLEFGPGEIISFRHAAMMVKEQIEQEVIKRFIAGTSTVDYYYKDSMNASPLYNTQTKTKLLNNIVTTGAGHTAFLLDR